MKPKIVLCFALVLSFVIWTDCVDAMPPVQQTSADQTQLEAQRQELCALLAKASPNSRLTNSPEIPGGPAAEFSPYLTESENARLLKLLGDPEIANAVPLELALAALKQRQLEASLPGFQYNALMDLVNRRWPHDPVVIAFYREALATRGDEAISELWSPLPGIWDDSLLEPVVRLIEKAGSDWALPHTNTSRDPAWFGMYNALHVLERHYSGWATNTSIPARLSKAVLTAFPSLKNASMPGPRPGNQMWCNAVRMLASTHDLGMIAVIRPFLNEKVVAGDGSTWVGYEPLRACDEAAIAIRSLLGDKDPADGGQYYASGGFRPKPGVTYPKWIEWDKKIADLQERLDALPKK